MGFFLGFIARVSSTSPPLQNLIFRSTSTMDDLAESLTKCFSTRPAEKEEIPVEDDAIPPLVLDGGFSLVGRVVSQKIFSGHSLRMNISRLIQPFRGFWFQDLGENQFVLRFNHKRDCE